MCNGYRHDPACTCGFGGDGHRGGGYGGRSVSLDLGYPGSNFRSARKFGMSSMTDLAAELGHSLVLPVRCYYCGRLVYLFASPEGGVTIFDELGPPWPKHECTGLSQNGTVNCTFPESRIPDYKVPVTAFALVHPCQNGDRLLGVIVDITPRHNLQQSDFVWEIAVFDGKRLYQNLLVDRDFPLGCPISGIITDIPGLGKVLENAKEYNPPVEMAVFDHKL